MVETYVSNTAMSATMPGVHSTEDIECRIIYDPFTPNIYETHMLKFQEGMTLQSYLSDIPEDAEWMIFHNGEEIISEDWANTPIRQGDLLGVIALPMGKGGLKSVLRIALQAVAIGLMFVPGIGTIASIAINMAIGLIGAFLLTPKPKMNDGGQTEKSYGIDGAKNSATEGIPYPVVYGEFRIAGNFSDTFTVNSGDSQILYLRTILNDGEIEDVTDIEVNEQPISSFQDVSTRIKMGTLDQDVNSWFTSSIRQVNKGVKLSTGWTTHITSERVDKVRFDIAFPQGLVEITKKKGKYVSKSVTFDLEYREVYNEGDGNWLPVGDGSYDSLPTDEPNNTYEGDGNAEFPYYIPGDSYMQFLARAAVASAGGLAPAVQTRAAGSSDAWITVGTFADDLQSQGYVLDPDGSLTGATNATPYLTNLFGVDGGSNPVEIRGINGAVVTSVSTYPNSGSSQITVSDRRTRAIRKSFTSHQIQHGHYECRIRRTNAQSTDSYNLDEVWLTDIAEIEVDPVAMRGTANLSMQIRLNDQLNGIPQLTAKVKGCILQEYDMQGGETVRRWSANPAWIGLDILVGESRGAGIEKSRIDWPAWIEFAEYCEANELTFNGVFAEGSNIGDVLREVLRIGHSMPIPFGTRISVATDKIRDHVTLFTQASMKEKSFQLNYLSMQDRSNEFELTYYDKSDRNKAKTIRYVDPKAVTFNELPKTASVTFPGIDNVEQARGEIWRMVYSNRLLVRTVSFEAFMEAINMNIGEVALIQHDMMKWANSGRTGVESSPSLRNVKTDQTLDIVEGETYNILVHHSSIEGNLFTVDTTASKLILVHSGGNSLTEEDKMANRVIVNGEDYQVVRIEDGSTYHTITVDRVPTVSTNDQLRLWRTDVIEERSVDAVSTDPDGISTVTVSTDLSAYVPEFSNFVFGNVEKVRKPYALTAITGNGVEKRKLTFMEYHEGVYGPAEVEIPTPASQVNDRIIPQVQSLMVDYDRVSQANNKSANVRLFWAADAIRNYGGADIYMRLNGGSWASVASAANVTEYSFQMASGDEVEFKAVAYSLRGDRAPYIQAPEVTVSLTMAFEGLDAPDNLAVTPISFEVEGRVGVAFDPPNDTTGIENYEVQYRSALSAEWVSYGLVTDPQIEIGGLVTGNYLIRIRSNSVTSISTWLTDAFAVSVAPGSLMDNWNNSNDRNSDVVVAPTLPGSGVVDHTNNTDGSANVSFDWLWSGTQSDIDGFVITVTDTPPA